MGETSFVVPGYLHETKDEVLDVVQRCRTRNIYCDVSIQHEDPGRVIISAESTEFPTWHLCRVLVELHERPGRQTHVSVKDNTVDGKCAKDGHLEQIAQSLKESWRSKYAYGARHRG